MLFKTGLFGKCISDGDRITERNSPDFSAGTYVDTSDRYKEAIRSKAKSRKLKEMMLYVITGVFMVIFLYFMTAEKADAAQVRLFILCGMFGLGGTAFLLFLRAFRSYKAADNGEIDVYRFRVTGKKKVSGNQDSASEFYIEIAGAAVKTSYKDYDRTIAGDDVFCAVFLYKDRKFFFFCGTELPV